jgi:hypothetical protein
MADRFAKVEGSRFAHRCVKEILDCVALAHRAQEKQPCDHHNDISAAI